MIGFRVESLPAVGSTNDVVRDRALAGEPEGLVVRAERQLAGRGRHGRLWTSPPGNLYASFLLRPKRPLNDLASLSLVAGLAVVETLGEVAPPGVVARLKWPNDVLIGDAKLAGILLESAILDPAAPIVVGGLGLNVVSHPADLPYPSTSLKAQGIDLDAMGMLQRFLAAFARLYAVWQPDGFAPLRARWLAHGYRLGSVARVRAGNHLIEGRIVDLDPAGRLVLETTAGRKLLDAGELFFSGGGQAPC